MSASMTQSMDFTLGFAEADQVWVDWIVWVLESAGYTIEQKAGEAAFQLTIDEIQGKHYIPIWSEQYLRTPKIFLQTDQIIMNYDLGQKKQVMPIQIDSSASFLEPDLITPLDLSECDRAYAQQKLLEAARSLPLLLNPPPQPPFRKPQPPFPGEPQELIEMRQRLQAKGHIEKLGDVVSLEMMQIPGGMFTMGTPENEAKSRDSERPIHRVTVQSFFMGRYPVTQAQWFFVAGLPQENDELSFRPSRFADDDRPVERVNWHDAIEFCARLSRYTGREYRLPTESEWEYACRGKTITPFHFGYTIDAEIANYRGISAYGSGRTGIYREETTPVGFFKVANAFGLYDMHGNVWEWCMDHWHDNYQGAPNNASAWIDSKAEEDTPRVLHGGSWYYNPGNCRSASRYRFKADYRDYRVGFRLVHSI
jgi:formylglycine-generating enzyme required for sulfatase activity